MNLEMRFLGTDTKDWADEAVKVEVEFGEAKWLAVEGRRLWEGDRDVRSS